MQRIAIGIDPGKSTGFAVKDVGTGQYLDIRTMQLHQAMQYALSLAYDTEESRELYFVVEDARKRKWYADHDQNEKARRGIAMGAASVKRDCTIWEEFLTDHGFTFRMIAPARLTTKTPLLIWTRKTGWNGRTSEHARDAADFIFPINPRNLKLFFSEKKGATNSIT